MSTQTLLHVHRELCGNARFLAFGALKASDYAWLVMLTLVCEHGAVDVNACTSDVCVTQAHYRLGNFPVSKVAVHDPAGEGVCTKQT